MGSKYKKQLEQKWDGQPISDMKLKMLHSQADRNITKLCKDKIRRRSK